MTRWTRLLKKAGMSLGIVALMSATAAHAGSMKTYWFCVFSNPVAGTEAEFNEWYTNQHQRDVVAVPGFVSAQRAVLADDQLIDRTDIPKMPKYLVIYAIETDDLKAVMAQVGNRVKSGRTVISPAFDRQTSLSYTYELDNYQTAPLRTPEGAKPGPMQTYWHIVFNVPKAGKEAEFNTWYNNQHAPDMLKTPGIVSSQRLVLVPKENGAYEPSKYAVLFTLKTSDMPALKVAFKNEMKTMTMSDVMASAAGYTYRLLGLEVSGDAVRASRANGGK